MSVYENAFEEALKNKLKGILYTYLNRMDKEGAWGVIFRIYSENDDEIRVVKVYKDPVNEINLKLYSKDVQKLKKHQNENIVMAYDTGFIEYKEEKYFFVILDYIKGNSLDIIDANMFWETPYNRRIYLLNQALETIEVFRTKYEVHNDLHLGNLMLSDDRIIIIDFGTSKFDFHSAESDYDLYSIKNELLEFFLTQKEISEIFNNINLKTVNFIEFKELIVNELPKKELEIDNNIFLRIQMFFNRTATLILNLVRDTLSSAEIKEIIRQLKNSEEKGYFGIEITQRNRGFQSKIDFINQEYILTISSDLSGTAKYFKKNNEVKDFYNFNNIIDLLNDLKEYIMRNFGIEIPFPENIPLCEVDLENLIVAYGETKMLGTEHIKLRIKNKSNFSIRILELGISTATLGFTYEKDVNIEPTYTYFKDIPYSVIKKQLEKSNIEEPYLLRGYAKLSTREVFFSREIEL